MSKDHSFEVWQDGIKVAAVSCAKREDAIRETMHYANVYRQDGPVEVKETTKK